MEEKDKLYRNKSACEACKERRRKCDGNPCSYCVGKNKTCTFLVQKKRGPAKKQRLLEPGYQTASLSSENTLADRVEMLKYLTIYFRFDKHAVFLSQNIDTLMTPKTVPLQIQLYSALATSAQSCGDFGRGIQFINHARALSGSVYDNVDCDVVKGFIMMRKYWYNVLDFVQCTHYANLSWSLAKFCGKLDVPVRMHCELAAKMADFTTSVEEKISFLKKSIATSKANFKAFYTRELRVFILFSSLAAAFLEHLRFDIFFLVCAETLFIDLSKIHLSPEARLHLLECVNDIHIEVSTLDGTTDNSVILIISKVFTPLYQAIVNWRSNRISEAMSQALQCVHAFDIFISLNISLHSSNLFGTVVRCPHITLMGSLMHFFMEQHQYDLATKVEAIIIAICASRGPPYAPIIKAIREFRSTGVVPVNNREKISFLPIIDTSQNQSSYPLSPSSPATSDPTPLITDTSNNYLVPYNTTNSINSTGNNTINNLPPNYNFNQEQINLSPNNDPQIFSTVIDNNNNNYDNSNNNNNNNNCDNINNIFTPSTPSNLISLSPNTPPTYDTDPLVMIQNFLINSVFDDSFNFSVQNV